MLFRFLILAALVPLAACQTTTASAPEKASAASFEPLPFRGAASTAGFSTVVARVEPVAERECRRRTRGVNCDYKILVDDRPNQPSNAYQTVDKEGRPLIVFTKALLNEAQNGDEIAFVMGHEAAHHIEGHLQSTQTNAAVGALILSGLVAASGADPSLISNAVDVGAMLGSRTYSKQYELEADRLGTIIAHNAGFDPIRGAVFFQRIPDPGDAFLGTHPPNQDRIRIVHQTARGF
ncbi:M48 family metalloprotease [Shimia biformata]|uniref:M48 family metalloprotease n=1 Tax=Shimia biformata TaxID=1294299 RepID=UPI0019507943|nr:M48 family metalloprotease [Shimia biformata]